MRDKSKMNILPDYQAEKRVFRQHRTEDIVNAIRAEYSSYLSEINRSVEHYHNRYISDDSEDSLEQVD